MIFWGLIGSLIHKVRDKTLELLQVCLLFCMELQKL
jgi:hypothetical protein